ncbi:MAG: T9SS type A sorting domain-containing protein [Bacteroidia bacterium]|nr:T9SS type A sorting domain-containing protein [Bacteroidia bacterium]
MKRHIITLIIGLTATTAVFGQTEIKLTINHLLGDQPFAFNQKATNDQGNEFNVNRLEYYLSKISIVHDGGQVSDASSVYILADGGRLDTISLGSHNVSKVEAINFSVGVDPSVNNGDPTKWPSGHALSPKLPSMHWGWASGYRFVAMEGKTGPSLTTIFEVHALGNKNFHDINIPTGATDHSGALLITLNADYTKALSTIDVGSGLINHGEDDEASRLLRNFTNKVFTSTTGEVNTLSVDKVKPKKSRVFPNPSTSLVQLDVGELQGNLADVEIRDVTGCLIGNKTVFGGGLSELAIENSGIYFVTVKYDSGSVETHKVLIY